jgi:hypothetical protein
MFILDASTNINKEVAPQIAFATAVGQTISSAEYVSVEYDLMIESSSGVDENSSYGNWQEALRNSGWGWDGHWVGALGGSYNTYTHMSFAIPNNATTYHWLTLALQGTTNYSTNVIGYIDNFVINPFQNPLWAGRFTNASDVGTWGSGQRASLSHGSLEAGGGSPAGSLQVDVAYDDSNTGWQEGLATYQLNFSPSRYTYAAFDLYVENPNNLTGFGIVQLFLNTGGWTFCGSVGVNTNHVGKWTHVEFAVPSSTTASQLIFQFGGGMTNGLRYYLDNIKLYKPDLPPTVAIQKAGQSGVQITFPPGSDQWTRDAIASPVDTGVMWSGSSPVTYSFTIADFPPLVNEGFEAHLFIVNGDTVSTGDQTYGGVDWNAADLVRMMVHSTTNGDYLAMFSWKTNRPGNNPIEDVIHRPAYLTNTQILGTWSLTFTDNTNITMSGPGGISTNFTIPEEAVLNSFNPVTSFLQFGFHKNDNENNGHNDGRSGTFSRVQKTGGAFVFDDTFNGQTLTNNYAWRKTSQSNVQHIPPGTGWFFNWTLPADAFTPQSAPTITGPWGDAGVTNIYQSGPKMFGIIPTSALPPGPNAFFRLYRPAP